MKNLCGFVEKHLESERILIDGRLLSNPQTGISRYTEQLIKAFVEKFGKGNVTVIIHPECHFTKDCNFIHTKYSPYNPVHFLFFSYFLNRQDFSVYYSPFYSGIWFKKDKRKQVITVHDLMYLRIRDYFSESSLKNCVSKFVFNLLVRATLRSCDLVISVSETTKNDLRELFGRDSVVVGEGVNELAETETGEGKKGRIGERENRRKELDDCTTTQLHEALEDGYFLYVGNFRKQKNVDFLIEAYLKSNTPYWLVLVGARRWEKGDGRKETGERTDKVIFTGALKDLEIHYLYKNCVAFVLPSLYEGFGLPVLEAYCAGARVLSSNAGALKEFDHLNIHYFSPENSDELISLLERADHLSKSTEIEIQEIKEKYCWEKQMGKLIERIEELRN